MTASAAGSPASKEEPLYAKAPQLIPGTLWMITWDEGWGRGVLCSGMYEADADFVLSLLGRLPRAGQAPSGTKT